MLPGHDQVDPFFGSDLCVGPDQTTKIFRRIDLAHIKVVSAREAILLADCVAALDADRSRKLFSHAEIDRVQPRVINAEILFYVLAGCVRYGNDGVRLVGVTGYEEAMT